MPQWHRYSLGLEHLAFGGAEGMLSPLAKCGFCGVTGAPEWLTSSLVGSCDEILSVQVYVDGGV